LRQWNWLEKVLLMGINAPRLLCLLWLALGHASNLPSAPPSGRPNEKRDNPFTCAACHREQATSSPSTAMGVGMELPPNQTVLKAHPKLSAHWKGYDYTVDKKDGASVYAVSDGRQSISLPIHYAFGVRMQTYVFVYQGRYFESLMSYYNTVGALDVTLGDERMEPKSLIEALGKEYTEATISRCFGCHSSDSVEGARLKLDSLRPGLDCEHCHSGANAHMAALAQGKTVALPESLGERGAEDSAAFCGTCHRSWEEVVRLRIRGPINVRFQPYRLSLSKCFIGNDKRIACTSCHNPHTELVRNNPKFYDAKCLACHATGTPRRAAIRILAVAYPSPDAPLAPLQKACPVSSENCTTCHMPKVELPGGHSIFNDHYIRVARTGEEYPN
jgi:hypothetical protein